MESKKATCYFQLTLGLAKAETYNTFHFIQDKSFLVLLLSYCPLLNQGLDIDFFGS